MLKGTPIKNKNQIFSNLISKNPFSSKSDFITSPIKKKEPIDIMLGEGSEKGNNTFVSTPILNPPININKFKEVQNQYMRDTFQEDSFKKYEAKCEFCKSISPIFLMYANFTCDHYFHSYCILDRIKESSYESFHNIKINCPSCNNQISHHLLRGLAYKDRKNL